MKLGQNVHRSRERRAGVRGARLDTLASAELQDKQSLVRKRRTWTITVIATSLRLQARQILYSEKHNMKRREEMSEKSEKSEKSEGYLLRVVNELQVRHVHERHCMCHAPYQLLIGCGLE